MKKYALFTVLFVLSLFNNATANSSVESLRQAAERGEVEAQFQLGTAYYTGMNVIQDYREAMKWYQKAAEQGLISAQHNLGVAYSKGLGVSQDERKAVQWYRKAAEQGDWRAQNNLGNLYSLGKGVAQNFQEAAYWYRKAAEQGYAIAQNNLGIAYQNGQGVPQDIQKAIQWYRKAAEQGYTEAQQNLAKFPPRATSSSVEKLVESSPFLATKAQNTETSPAQEITAYSPKTPRSKEAATVHSSERPEEIAPSKKMPGQASKAARESLLKEKKTVVHASSIAQNHPKKEVMQPKETLVQTLKIAKESMTVSFPKKDSKEPEIVVSHATEIQAVKKRVDLSRYTLALHYTDPQDADFIKRLSIFLQEKGYIVDRVNRMDIQLYRPQWDIRYYDDATAATALKQHIETFVDHTQAADSSPIQIKNFSFLSKTRKIRKGRLEIWLLNPTIKRL